MRKRIIILLAVTALFVMALAIPAAANPVCDDARIHPGHCGYVASGQQNSNAAPVNHFHTGGDPLYAPGAGGWGEAVSAAAKGQGLKKAHGG
jgi:hypothetical protein